MQKLTTEQLRAHMSMINDYKWGLAWVNTEDGNSKLYTYRKELPLHIKNWNSMSSVIMVNLYDTYCSKLLAIENIYKYDCKISIITPNAYNLLEQAVKEHAKKFISGISPRYNIDTIHSFEPNQARIHVNACVVVNSVVMNIGYYVIYSPSKSSLEIYLDKYNVEQYSKSYGVKEHEYYEGAIKLVNNCFIPLEPFFDSLNEELKGIIA